MTGQRTTQKEENTRKVKRRRCNKNEKHQQETTPHDFLRFHALPLNSSSSFPWSSIGTFFHSITIHFNSDCQRLSCYDSGFFLCVSSCSASFPVSFASSSFKPERLFLDGASNLIEVTAFLLEIHLKMRRRRRMTIKTRKTMMKKKH